MRTQPRVNEAATEKQAPCKINIKKKKISHSMKWLAMKKSQQNKKEN